MTRGKRSLTPYCAAYVRQNGGAPSTYVELTVERVPEHDLDGAVVLPLAVAADKIWSVRSLSLFLCLPYEIYRKKLIRTYG